MLQDGEPHILNIPQIFSRNEEKVTYIKYNKNADFIIE
jgi:hypothetical protein